jgi:DNA-binding GntR family transcriptional regulator
MADIPLSIGASESQVERAYASIKAGIIDGRYPPGAPLSEPTLASHHGMSRTPIREGLSRLWQEGYLDRIPGRGYFVARVTVQSVQFSSDSPGTAMPKPPGKTPNCRARKRSTGRG